MNTAIPEKKIPCALCKQPVEIAGFCLQTAEGEKHFCCDGCLYVYQLLNENTLPPDNPNPTFKR
jgi:hypothetical protein